MSFWRKFYSLSAVVICLIGLATQINEVSNKYFAYTTETKISINNHYVISAPQLSACFRVADILKRDLIKKELGIDLIQRPISAADWIKYTQQVDKFTVRQLLEFTPRVEELIGTEGGYGSCALKFPMKDFDNVFSSDKECYQHFRIRKYHHRSMICYKITPNFSVEMLNANDYLMKTGFENYFGLIFYVNINAMYFNDTRSLTAYVHENHSVDIIDSYLAPVVLINKPEITLRVSYQTLKIEKLPPPYDTMCGKYPVGSSQFDQVYKNLQTDAVKMFNRSIPDVMIYDLLDTPILSVDQLKQNATLSRIYRSIWEQKKANMPNTCSFITTIPKMYIVDYSSMGMTLMWPNGLRVYNQSRARLILIDYLVYVFSCIGIWLGLSFYGIFDLIEGLKKTLYATAPTTEEASMELMMARVIKRVLKLEAFMTQSQKETKSRLDAHHQRL